MAKSPKRADKPTAKDAQRQREDEILKRMLETPPTPHKKRKSDGESRIKKRDR